MFSILHVLGFFPWMEAGQLQQTVLRNQEGRDTQQKKKRVDSEKGHPKCHERRVGYELFTTW